MSKKYTENMYERLCNFFQYAKRFRDRQLSDSDIIFINQLLLLGTINVDLNNKTRQITCFTWKCSLCSSKEYFVDLYLGGCVDIFHHLNLVELSLHTDSYSIIVKKFADIGDVYENVCEFRAIGRSKNFEFMWLIDEINDNKSMSLQQRDFSKNNLPNIFSHNNLYCVKCDKILVADDHCLIVQFGVFFGKNTYSSSYSIIIHRLEHIMKEYKNKKITCVSQRENTQQLE